MATHHITGHITSSVAVTTSDDIYILDKDATIHFNGTSAFLEQNTFSNNHLIIEGSIRGGSDWLESDVNFAGLNSNLLIKASGELTGNAGVFMGDASQTVTNWGKIVTDGYGITADHGGSIFNHGLIRTTIGVTTGSSSVSVTNEANARIITDNGIGIVLANTGAEISTLINHGLIKSPGGLAFEGTDGEQIVQNRGVMSGKINMGSGNDVFNTVNGSVDHRIAGQDGNDTLITDNASISLKEGVNRGIDTVKSTVSYTLSDNVEDLVLLGKANVSGTGNREDNSIDGSKGDNVLSGGRGADTLDGHAGHDIMTGGMGSDTFLFKTGSGHDTITDFETVSDKPIGSDQIDLSAQTVITDFNDMVTNHVTNHHGNLIIHCGGDTLTLEHTKMGELDAQNFVF